MRTSVRDAMLAAVPSLRAFAISLSGNVDRADDLVQETLLRAMANIDSFQPGTNMSAWLFTILRNLFRSEYRKRRREVEDTDGSYAESLKSHPEQQSRVEFENSAWRSRSCRPTSVKRSSWSARRVLLRGGGGDLRMRGRHHQEPGQSRAPASGFCPSTAPMISALTTPRGQYYRPVGAADSLLSIDEGHKESRPVR
jgi:RNA polymerase sigma factor (sigma-70 family)